MRDAPLPHPNSNNDSHNNSNNNNGSHDSSESKSQQRAVLSSSLTPESKVARGVPTSSSSQRYTNRTSSRPASPRGSPT